MAAIIISICASIISILNLDDESFKDIEDNSQEILKRQEINKRFSCILISVNSNKDFAPILLFCNTTSYEYATRQKVLKQTLAMAEAQNLDSLQYLVLVFENTKIISADCGKITTNNIINKNEEYIGIVNYIKNVIKDETARRFKSR